MTFDRARRWRGNHYLGSPTLTRTRDKRINSPLLYRLSYRGIDRAFHYFFSPGLTVSALLLNPRKGIGDLASYLPRPTGEESITGYILVSHKVGVATASRAY